MSEVRLDKKGLQGIESVSQARKVSHLACQKGMGACGWKGRCCSGLPRTCRTGRWTPSWELMGSQRGMQLIAARHPEALPASEVCRMAMGGRWMLEAARESTHGPACKIPHMSAGAWRTVLFQQETLAVRGFVLAQYRTGCVMHSIGAHSRLLRSLAMAC